MYYVTKASYVKDFQIFLAFNDQKSGVVDLSQTIKNDKRAIFKELTDLNLFKNFKVEMDTVVWSNGLDLAPEYLHDLFLKQQKNGH
ncbi:MAG: DUF2442 domain-containing protein [Rickettsiales bacterium]|nr:DUF2442 domain-containing protein [Rickettsiales bacterium]